MFIYKINIKAAFDKIWRVALKQKLIHIVITSRNAVNNFQHIFHAG